MADQHRVSGFLEKMTAIDKDFRFMAVSDFHNVLATGNYTSDGDQDLRAAGILMKLLKDPNAEVQNEATQCLATFVKYCRSAAIDLLIDGLLKDLVGQDERICDISALVLKTVIPAVAAQQPFMVNTFRKLGKGVTNALTMPESAQRPQLALDSLEILSSLIQTMSAELIQQSGKKISDIIWQFLCHTRLAIRKRAMVALGHLSPVCSDQVFHDMITQLQESLTVQQDVGITRSMIQSISLVCSQSGSRFAPFMSEFMTFLLKMEGNKEHEELLDFILQAYECFSRKCPQEFTNYLSDIVSQCLRALKFDPNYNYGSDDEGEEAMDDDNDEEDEDDEDYSDDDDTSWKIRRAAAKCLTSLINTRPDQVSTFYTTISPTLISRFKEREENVKVDILGTYVALLSSTTPLPKGVTLDQCQDSAIVQLREQTDLLVKVLGTTMKDKSPRVRQACFTLLAKLVQVAPGILSPHTAAIMRGVHYSLVDTKSIVANIKTDSLAFLRVFLATHPPEILSEHVIMLIPPVLKAVDDSFYKVIGEALLVLQQLVPVVRPLGPPPDQVTGECMSQFVKPVYEATLSRLRVADIDQEVKEQALMTMGTLFHHCADCLQPELQQVLPLYIDRLNNEVTRIAAAKAITIIAETPLQLDMQVYGSSILALLSSFLRQTLRALKIVSLEATNSLLRVNSQLWEQQQSLMAQLVTNTLPLISAGDLHVAQLSLTLMATVAEIQASAFAQLDDEKLRSLLKILQSPLVQGGVLQAFVNFLQVFSLKTSKNILPLLDEFINAKVKGGGLVMHKQCYHSFALCIASLIAVQPALFAAATESILATIQNASASESVQLCALLTLGEIGRSQELAPVNVMLILNCFAAASDDVKTAASVCLGLLCAGKPDHYMSIILEKIKLNSAQQYLLLHALREAITVLASSSGGIMKLAPFSDPIWDLLFLHCESNEEGTRNMVAECIGKLTLVDPERRLPILQGKLSVPDVTAVARVTVISAVRFTVSEQKLSVDTYLQSCIGDFLKMLEDPDVNVRRVTLLLLNSVAHNKPSLINEQLQSILPLLYGETRLRPELIREVEMGPFKHQVDDGLDLRKAAFECMYTLLETCLSKLDIFEFLKKVEAGVTDHYDIKMLSHLMIVRLSELTPVALLQRFCSLSPLLKSTFISKPKANAVKQELEKLDELKRSVLRCIAAVDKLPDARRNGDIADLIKVIEASEMKDDYLRMLGQGTKKS